MKYLAISLLTFFLFACVMPSDLRTIADSQQDYQEEVLGVLADSTLSSDEKVEAIEEAQEVTLGQIEAVMLLIKERTETIVKAPGALTGNGLLDLLLTAAAATVTGAAASNQIRDRRRLARGEPISPTKP